MRIENYDFHFPDYVRQLEEEFVEDDDLSIEFHRDTHLIMDLPKRNRHTLHHGNSVINTFECKRFVPNYIFFSVIEYCLVAILSHSTIKSHCQILLKTNLLSLLLRVAESFPNNIRLKSLIGKIIANMCLFQENHTQLAASGWIGVLAKWSRDKNILINLPALKALANLDQKFADCSYGPGIYLMLPNDR